MIDGIRIESDEDGWHLVLSVDDADRLIKSLAESRWERLDLPIHHLADELLEQTRQIAEWQAEGRQAARDHEYELTRQREEDHIERMLEAGDNARKADKERGR